MSNLVFRHPHRVTYADCTLGNHIYYARYLDLIEAARSEFFRWLGFPLLGLQAEEILFPVIEARLRYKSPARYDDVLEIAYGPVSVERVRLNCVARITRPADGKLILEAEVFHVCASLAEKPRRMPPELLSKLKALCPAGNAADASTGAAGLLPARVFNADALAVRVYPTLEAMAAAAAREAHTILREAVQARGEARVIFACAASQVRFLEILTRLPGLDWARVTVFHMDEYLGIPASHPASFRRFLRERVVDVVRPGVCHYLAGEAPDAGAECARYTGLLRERPIDLCCLGIGENGHVAFNDPPFADFDDPHTVKVVTLDARCRQQQVGEGAFPALDEVPKQALTLTVPALCAARRMVGVVPERRKAAAVRDALRGPIHPGCPASVLRRQAHGTLLLDAEAAAFV